MSPIDPAVVETLPNARQAAAASDLLRRVGSLERRPTTVGAAQSGSAGGVLSGSFPNPGFAVDMATQAELDAKMAAGAAGGVLAGAYPNPSFAVDMATQAELDAHAALSGNGSHVPAAGVTNANVATAAAIAYSKLALSGSIVTGDLAFDPATQAELDAGLALKQDSATAATDTELNTGLALKVAKAGDTMTGALLVHGSADALQLKVRAHSTQTANLQEWQSGGGGLLGRVDSLGILGFNYARFGIDQTFYDYNALRVTSVTTGSPVAVVKGMASQTADLQQWQNSVGTSLVSVSAAGGLVTTGNVGIGINPLGPLHVYGGSGAINMRTLLADSVDTYNLGVYTAGATSRFIVSSDTGTQRQAMVFSDTGTATTSFGISRSTDSGVTWSPVFAVRQDGNLGIGTAGEFGSGAKVVGLANATTTPSTNPTGGGVFYSSGGEFKWRDTTGAIWTMTKATGHTVRDETTALTQRTSLDFQGAGVVATDDAANDKTIVTIPGGGGGGSATTYTGIAKWGSD